MRSTRQSHRRRRGFSLLELMIAIAILAILVAVIVVATTHVRAAAEQTGVQSALRGLAFGVQNYANENEQRIIPGYLGVADGDDLVEQFNVDRPSPGGGDLLFDDARTWVWRLAPYLDDSWETAFEGYPKEAREFFRAQVAEGIYGFGSGAPNGGVAESPAIGMNTIFVGGDTRVGGAAVADRHPWNQDGLEPLAATRMSQVRNAARLIVFAPAGLASTTISGDDVYDSTGLPTPRGFYEIRAPFLEFDGASWSRQQWRVDDEELMVRTVAGEYADGCGLPIDRPGTRQLPVVHLDASTSTEDVGEIGVDMRRWAPTETGRRPITPDDPLG